MSGSPSDQAGRVRAPRNLSVENGGEPTLNDHPRLVRSYRLNVNALAERMKTWAEYSGCKKTSGSPPESLVPANWKFTVPKRMSEEIAMASSVRLVYACLNRLKPWQEAVGRLRVLNDNGCPSEDSLSLSCKRWRCSQQRDVSCRAHVVTLTSKVLGSHLIDF